MNQRAPPTATALTASIGAAVATPPAGGLEQAGVPSASLPEQNLKSWRKCLPVINLLAIVITGVCSLIWVLRFTEWYEVIGGFLSLTGAFAWLAFVLKILPEDRVNDMRSSVFETLFNRWHTLLIAVVIFVLLFLIACSISSIQLEPLRESSDRAVWVDRVAEPAKYQYPTRDTEQDFERLAVGGHVRWPVVCWFSKAQFIVKVSGYPDKLVTAVPLRRVDLYVPNSFLRPVVLLRPTQELLKSVRNNEMMIEVTIGQQSYRRKFDGHAIWIGCDEEVRVPAALQEAWKNKLTPELIDFWLAPQQLSPNRFELNVHQKIKASLFRVKDGGLYTQRDFYVRPLLPHQEFYPQVQDIDEPTNIGGSQ